MLQTIGKKLGVIPNLYRVTGHSPRALAGLWALSTELSHTHNTKLRERVSMAVAAVNGCDYCLSAHTYIGVEMVKLSRDEAERARHGSSEDPKVAAALRFVVEVADKRGQVDDATLLAIRNAGYSDAEVVALVAENVLTNFLNNVAQTDIDFPVVRAKSA